MKKLLLLILIILFSGGTVWADQNALENDPVPWETIQSAAEKIVQICPYTRLEDSCLDCHVIPDWTLKEKQPDANRSLPLGPTMSFTEGGKVAHLLITGISSAEVDTFFEYIRWHPEIRKCVFEIFSPGGSLFEAWRIIGLMELWKSKGMIIETRVHGFAASAGFILFANGTPGYRFASETAELMWHELYTFEFFKVSRPSLVEDEAIVLRHLQTTASKYLADRSNLTAEEWDQKTAKKEFWCNGKEAQAFGLSDGLPGNRTTKF